RLTRGVARAPPGGARAAPRAAPCAEQGENARSPGRGPGPPPPVPIPVSPPSRRPPSAPVPPPTYRPTAHTCTGPQRIHRRKAGGAVSGGEGEGPRPGRDGRLAGRSGWPPPCPTAPQSTSGRAAPPDRRPGRGGPFGAGGMAGSGMPRRRIRFPAGPPAGPRIDDGRDGRPYTRRV